MPTYNFKCAKCDHLEEIFVPKIVDDELVPCPGKDCEGMLHKAFTKPEGGFILKGDGWHKGGGHV